MVQLLEKKPDHERVKVIPGRGIINDTASFILCLNLVYFYHSVYSILFGLAEKLNDIWSC